MLQLVSSAADICGPLFVDGALVVPVSSRWLLCPHLWPPGTLFGPCLHTGCGAPHAAAAAFTVDSRAAALPSPNAPAPLQENFVSFLPNYLRLAAAVLLATFYLRPKALLGAAALAVSLYRSISRALERQAADAAAAQIGGRARGGSARGPAAAAAGAAGGAAADPNEQLITAGLTVVTWVLVAYTRCMPVLLLGMVASLVAVLAHCGLRRAPSEYRYKGRQPLGFTLRQLLGQGACDLGGWAGVRGCLLLRLAYEACMPVCVEGALPALPAEASRACSLLCIHCCLPFLCPTGPLAEPVPDGCHPAGLFSEIAQASWQAAGARWRWAKRYARYYLITAWDSLRHPRSLLPPSTSSGLS